MRCFSGEPRRGSNVPICSMKDHRNTVDKALEKTK
jgi:hypothetical protein